METKRLYRSRDHRVVAGVAGGLATYLGIDPALIRLAFVLLTIFNGMGLLLYLVLWLIVPNIDTVYVEAGAQVRENVDEMRNTAESVVERIRGAFTA